MVHFFCKARKETMYQCCCNAIILFDYLMINGESSLLNLAIIRRTTHLRTDSNLSTSFFLNGSQIILARSSFVCMNVVDPQLNTRFLGAMQGKFPSFGRANIILTWTDQLRWLVIVKPKYRAIYIWNWLSECDIHVIYTTIFLRQPQQNACFRVKLHLPGKRMFTKLMYTERWIKLTIQLMLKRNKGGARTPPCGRPGISRKGIRDAITDSNKLFPVI